MKKTLLLMRHGEAKEKGPAETDFERPLTPHGEQVVRHQAAAMMEKNLWPDVVLCSSAIRTRQTADILRITWEGDMEPMIENRTDLYHCEPIDVIKMLRAQDPNHTTMMVIGHNPVIHHLALVLSAAIDPKAAAVKSGFPPASCAVLEMSLRSWSEVGEGKATLVDLLSP